MKKVIDMAVNTVIKTNFVTTTGSAVTSSIENIGLKQNDFDKDEYNAMVFAVNDRINGIQIARDTYRTQWIDHVKEVLAINWNLGFDSDESKAVMKHVDELKKLIVKASDNITSIQK